MLFKHVVQISSKFAKLSVTMSIGDTYLTKSEVHDFYVTNVIQQNVFRFQIAIDKIQMM